MLILRSSSRSAVLPTQLSLMSIILLYVWEFFEHLYTSCWMAASEIMCINHLLQDANLLMESHDFFWEVLVLLHGGSIAVWHFSWPLFINKSLMVCYYFRPQGLRRTGGSSRVNSIGLWVLLEHTKINDISTYRTLWKLGHHNKQFQVIRVYSEQILCRKTWNKWQVKWKWRLLFKLNSSTTQYS